MLMEGYWNQSRGEEQNNAIDQLIVVANYEMRWTR